LYRSCRGLCRLPLAEAELGKPSVAACRDVLQGNENGNGHDDDHGLCGDASYGPKRRLPFSCLGVGDRPLPRRTLLELEEALLIGALSERV